MEPELRPGRTKATREKDKDVKQIFGYLEKKVNGEPLPPDVEIPEFNLYGNTKPWEVFDKAESAPGKSFLVFTKVANRTAKRKLRSCGSGKWNGKTVAKEVKTDDVVLGEKKIFTYVPSKSSDQGVNGYWSMSEYSLPEDEATGCCSGYVICKIVYKAGSRKKRRTGREPVTTKNTEEEEQPPSGIGKRERSDEQVDEEAEEAIFQRMKKLSRKFRESIKKKDLPSGGGGGGTARSCAEEEELLREEWKNATTFARETALLLLEGKFSTSS